MNNRGFIDKYGVFVTVIVTVLGVTVFAYPKYMTQYSGTNGWLFTIIGGAIACGIAYMMYTIISINNYNRYDIILKDSFGNVISKIIIVIFISYIILIISSELRAFAEMIKMYLIQKTPLELILVTFILTAVSLIRGDLRVLIGFNGIAFWVMIIPLLVSMAVSVGEVDFTNILPLMQTSDVDYVKAIRTALFAFGGFEILFLIIPYVKNKKESKSVLKWSFLLIIFVYCFTLVFTLAMFSSSQTKILLWPSISLIRSIQLPGSIIEHWEGVVMTFFIMFYFTTFVNLFYFAADLLKNTFKLYDVKLTTIILTPLIFIVALLPSNISEVRELETQLFPVFALTFLIILPVILFIIAIIKRRDKNEENNK
ncbi:GerAB/ArcD/ProY family transporter [Oceanirhabdus sp. W0125-5]|uniref:GerAB/ArcD/ProY family transporter n=1 Tax=Oceanirhabdus sp. W0125-5 TaxID=2999116 RepID=UPI0022F3185D|nr:endospore germination permease [Oceanirhabdus sp. W0125-5]WBW98463.1 endospore germination permease [Oceanirhabdus sp. W0125-5]